MRTSAGTSSDLVAPTSGWSNSPSMVSSATFWRYSCARCTGLRVWKPTTVFQPFSSIALRLDRREAVLVEQAVGGPAKHLHGSTNEHVALRIESSDAGMLVLRRAEAL